MNKRIPEEMQMNYIEVSLWAGLGTAGMITFKEREKEKTSNARFPKSLRLSPYLNDLHLKSLFYQYMIIEREERKFKGDKMNRGIKESC